MTAGQAIGATAASLPEACSGSLGEAQATIQQNRAASRRLMTAVRIPVERDREDAVVPPSPDARSELHSEVRATVHPDARTGPRPDTQTALHRDARAERHSGAAGCLLEFDSVTFGYEPQRAILDGACFRVKEREKAALVGPSGGGKTSVLRLIQRFYEPWKGTIRLRERHLAYAAQGARSQVGPCSQEPFIFPERSARTSQWAMSGLP